MCSLKPVQHSTFFFNLKTILQALTLWTVRVILMNAVLLGFGTKQGWAQWTTASCSQSSSPQAQPSRH